MDKNWYLAYAVETRRRDEEVANAEAGRLTELAGGAAPDGLKFYQLWLFRLGDLLVAWGSRLRFRYSRLMAVNSPQNISQVNTSPY